MLSIFWMPFTGVKRLQKPLKPSNPEMEILPERFVQKVKLFCVNPENFVRINNLLTFPFCYPLNVFIRQQKFITFRRLYRFRHFAQRREICPNVSKDENITFFVFYFRPDEQNPHFSEENQIRVSIAKKYRPFDADCDAYPFRQAIHHGKKVANFECQITGSVI